MSRTIMVLLLLSLAGACAESAADPGASKAACRPACEHRASCGLGDAAACTKECSALVDAQLLASTDLSAYAAEKCEKVKATEPAFQIAASCRSACAHRAECVSGISMKECIPDCAALVIASGQQPRTAIAPYLAKSCSAVKADEPLLACVHACTHALGCGVTGDLGGCLSYCGDALKKGTTLEQLAQISKLDCTKVKASITLPTAAKGQGLCRAAGVYTVCDGTFCRDRTADSAGIDRTDALRACGAHLTNMVIASQIANRAYVKQTCQITSCGK